MSRSELVATYLAELPADRPEAAAEAFAQGEVAVLGLHDIDIALAGEFQA